MAKNTNGNSGSKVTYKGQTYDLEKLKAYRDYQKKYTKETYKSFAVRLHMDRDKDIIQFLQDKNYVPDITKFIREVLRAEMDRKKFKYDSKKKIK